MTAPTLIRRAERTAPVPTPMRGTLLDLVTPIEGITWGEPTGLYTSINCITTDAVTPMCPDNSTSKTFQGLTIVDGFRFAVYTGVTCKSVGLNWDDIEAQVRAVQARKESQAVEKGLMDYRFSGAAPFDTLAPVDLTPSGGAVKPEVGLALLEGDAAIYYSGEPTLHLPRTIASLLSGNRAALHWEGNVLNTALGAKVAAGAGYEVGNIGPDGSTPAEGEFWLYGSGEVQLARGPLQAVPYQVNTSTNDVVLLIERVYVASVDCYTAAVRVTINE